MEREILFYDIECFSHDSLVVFMNLNSEVVAYYWSTGYDKFDEPNGFEDIPKLIEGKTMCGYNNHWYDDKMLSIMIRGLPQKAIKRVNDRIISGDPCKDFTNYPFAETLDCMQQIDVSHPSLKQIEGNMGIMVLESAIPFDIGRPLTPEEKEEVLRYCCHDVRAAIRIYKLRKRSYFDPKRQLVSMLGNEKAMNWNTTTISGNLLLKKPLPKWHKLKIPTRFWRNVEGIPEEAWDMWKSAETEETKGKSLKYHAFDMDFTFGFGGLHGVASEGRKWTDVKLLDVGSMYPSIVILLQALGPESTQTYDKIRRQRLAIKHTDKLLSDALKLVLNSVYGNLKNKYSILYNPLASVTVCVFGQIALFDLCRELYDCGFQLVNANTDGIAFVDSHIPERKDLYEAVWHNWEEKWGLNLELDVFDKWIQKDVNNYVAVKPDGAVKVKGAETNKYIFDPDRGTHKLFSNNSIRIVQMALVDYLLYDKPPVDTIVDNLDKPELFQFILKAGGTYKGVFDSEGNQVYKVNRVFAGNHRAKTTKLYKKRMDNGLVNFPDAPDKMLVWNEDCKDFKDFADYVDVNYYLQLAKKKLKGWL